MSIPSTHLSLLQALREEGRREDAWAVFQAGYRDVILGWGQSYGLDLHAAEDLTQEILIKLLEALPRYKHDPDRGRFRSWLKTVVHHVLADRQRRQRRRPEPEGAGGSTALVRLGQLPSPEAVEELSATVERRTAAWEAGVLDRVRARVEPATWAAFCGRMIERRPAAGSRLESGPHRQRGSTRRPIASSGWRSRSAAMRRPQACPDESTLRGFLQDQLAADDAGRIDEHIGGCQACQRALDLLVGSLPGRWLPGAEEATGHVPTIRGANGSLGVMPRTLLDAIEPGLYGMTAAAEGPARLHLLGEIARGGMGAILKGRDVALGRDLRTARQRAARPATAINAEP